MMEDFKMLSEDETVKLLAEKERTQKCQLLLTYIHTYIHSLFGNAGYRIRKTEFLMWTCLLKELPN